jgi:hypothetical protein
MIFQGLEICHFTYTPVVAELAKCTVMESTYCRGIAAYSTPWSFKIHFGIREISFYFSLVPNSRFT